MYTLGHISKADENQRQNIFKQRNRERNTNTQEPQMRNQAIFVPSKIIQVYIKWKDIKY